MKTILIAVCAAFITVLQVSAGLADDSRQDRSEADAYYLQGDFNKAYKAYLKLAKTGDHHAQHQLATIFANGEGKKVNLTDAYAWSVLAAEGGDERFAESSEALLQRIDDKNKALHKAARLQKKYGKEALAMKSNKKGSYIPGSDCTGTKLGCRSH